jgi:hypothetical protein
MAPSAVEVPIPGTATVPTPAVQTQVQLAGKIIASIFNLDLIDEYS